MACVSSLDQKLLDEIDNKILEFEFETGTYPTAIAVPLDHYEAVVRSIPINPDAVFTSINIHELNKLEYKGMVLRWDRSLTIPCVG